MPVSSSHRLLYGESPQSAGKRIWVVSGSHLQDWYVHNQLHGCVTLRRTLELWALEGGKQLTVTLRRDGELDFSGNHDPAAAEQLFSGTQQRRAPRYGNRPGTTPRSEPAGEDEAATARARQVAAGAQQAAGGGGQALLNTVTRLTQFLQSQNAPGLVIIEDLHHILEALSLNQQNAAAIHSLRSILQNEWHREVAPGNLVVFLARDRSYIEDVLPPKLFPKVEWKQTGKPSAGEVAAALDRLAMRHGALISGGKAMAKILADQEDTLELALGKVIDLFNRNEREITVGKVLDIPPINEQKIREVKEELNRLVGLDDLKAKVELIEKRAREIRKNLLEGNAPPPDDGMHMIFSGPPGTGKTTAARIVAGLFNAVGLLKKVEPKEVRADEILSSNREESGENMRRIIQESRGAVLFIDEAHQLGDEHSPGADEVVKVLVPAAENLRRELVVILAGYSSEMHTLLAKDPGLSRRFPEHNRILFPDYSLDQLWDILQREVRQRGFTIDPAAEARFRALLAKRSRSPGFGNAGGVRNLVSNVLELHSSGPASTVKVITPHSLPPLVRRDQALVDAAFAELDAMLGISDVTRQFRQVMESIKYDLDEEEAGRGSGSICSHPGNMRFVGPPGTGKTTVARLMKDLLYGMGCLERPVLLELSPGSLTGKYMGWSQANMRDYIKQGLGGVIFIDEAYGLVQGENDTYGQQIVTVLVEEITKPENSGTVFIIAGYKELIAAFIRANAGLDRRFPREIAFPNLSPADCAELVRRELIRRQHTWEEGTLDRIRELAAAAIVAKGERFGNAGWVKDELLPSILSVMKSRINNAAMALDDPERRKILLADMPGWPVTGTAVSRASDSRPEAARAVQLHPWTPSPESRFLPSAASLAGTTNETDIVGLLGNSAFQIITSEENGRGSATGFFVTPDGLLATCAHVVQGAKTVAVLCGRNRDPRSARPVAVDEGLDLALLAVDSTPPVPYLPLGTSVSLQPLADLIVFGNAHVQPSEPGRVVTARVARNDPGNPRALESDGAIEKGFSGGPALDMSTGAVVGIVSGGYGVSATELIRADQLCSLLEELGYRFSASNRREGEADGNSGN